MRLPFIFPVDLYGTDDRPPPTRVFFNENACCTNPTRFPCGFSGKMRVAVIVIVNSNDPRPTAPDFRIFFQLKRASRKPFQIPSVFTSKTRLAFNVIVNLYDSRPTASTFLVSFIENARRRNPATVLGFTFVVFSQVQCVLGSQVIVNSHVMMPAPAGCRFFFQGKSAPHRNRREVSKLEQRHMLTKEHCK